MPGNPERKIKLVSNLVEWHKELSLDFDKALPSIYRFNGVASTCDARRDAWANADRCVVMTGAALELLERVLRSAAIERAKPRGRPKEKVDERIGTPMYADE